MKKYCLVGTSLLLLACYSQAQTTLSEVTIPSEELDSCLRSSIVGAADTMSVRELKEACSLLLEKKIATQTTETVTPASPSSEATKEATENRVTRERMTIEALNRSNRFMLTPHKRNYILPAAYKSHPNREPYVEANDQLQNLKHTEAEFQFSVKILLREGIFNDNGHLYLGYTNHAFWQVYNGDISRPFRETNHQPELILSFTNDWEIFGFRNVLNEGIINHQSNGQGGTLSRSWNRIMFNSVFEKDNLAFSFKPWYRLPESKAKYPGDPKGDDNPDIEKFLGHFEFTTAFQHRSNIFSMMVRNNFRSENKGAVELGWSFPVSQRSQTIRGYVKYFNGYGESLIDYNDYTQTIGLGVIFTDLF